MKITGGLSGTGQCNKQIVGFQMEEFIFFCGKKWNIMLILNQVVL